MISPFEKISRRGNDTIQIIVSLSCDLYKCSNCTQLLPFRKDYRHMSLEVFREAVESVRDWPGIIGIFGGNPCAHPKFAEMMKIFCEVIPNQRNRGLWTNNLLSHGQLCQDVFYPHGRFNLNAHADEVAAREIDRWLPRRLIETSRNTEAWHSPILTDRKDFGVSDEEWVSLRENCDINQKWSGAIAERDGHAYGYFCEVAASLDGVRGENHGVRVFPEWWRRGMDLFEHQVRECCDRGCGVPLRGKGHLDRQNTYDITKSWAPHTESKVVKTHVLNEQGSKAVEATDYLRRWTEEEA